jgi:hypothetical protein
VLPLARVSFEYSNDPIRPASQVASLGGIPSICTERRTRRCRCCRSRGGIGPYGSGSSHLRNAYSLWDTYSCSLRVDRHIRQPRFSYVELVLLFTCPRPDRRQASMLPPHSYILNGVPTKFRKRLEGHPSDAEFVFTAEELISETVRFGDADVLMDIFSLIHALPKRWNDRWKGGRMAAMADIHIQNEVGEEYACRGCGGKKVCCYRANTRVE